MELKVHFLKILIDLNIVRMCSSQCLWEFVFLLCEETVLIMLHAECPGVICSSLNKDCFGLLNTEGRSHFYLTIVVDARDQSVEIKQVEGSAESVTQCSQSRCLQVLQLTHECGMILFPTRLPYTETHTHTHYVKNSSI